MRTSAGPWPIWSYAIAVPSFDLAVPACFAGRDSGPGGVWALSVMESAASRIVAMIGAMTVHGGEFDGLMIAVPSTSLREALRGDRGIPLRRLPCRKRRVRRDLRRTCGARWR